MYCCRGAYQTNFVPKKLLCNNHNWKLTYQELYKPEVDITVDKRLPYSSYLSQCILRVNVYLHFRVNNAIFEDKEKEKEIGRRKGKKKKRKAFDSKDRSSHLEVFWKIAILKNVAKLTGKYVWASSFLMKRTTSRFFIEDLWAAASEKNIEGFTNTQCRC